MATATDESTDEPSRDGTLAVQGSALLAADTSITGTDGDDILEGTPEADTIHGLAGADTLSGGDGNDTLSGGAGDTPGLLRAAMAAGPPEGSVFAFFNDPDLVSRAAEAGVGAQLDAALGGRLDTRFGTPVKARVDVERLTDGRFVNAGPMEAGRPVDLGPTALLRAGPMQIIVTSSAQSPNDTAYFALHGIDLRAVPVLFAKAKNHFMAALGPAFDTVLQVDTAGPAMADLRALPFRHVPARRFDLGAKRKPENQEVS